MTDINQILVDILASRYDIRSLWNLYLSSNFQRQLIDQKVPMLAQHFDIVPSPATFMEFIDAYVLVIASKLEYDDALKVAIEWDNENAVRVITQYLASYLDTYLDKNDDTNPPFIDDLDLLSENALQTTTDLVVHAIKEKSYRALRGFANGWAVMADKMYEAMGDESGEWAFTLLNNAIDFKDLIALKILLDWDEETSPSRDIYALHASITDRLDDEENQYISTILTHPNVNICELLKYSIEYMDGEVERLEGFIERDTENRPLYQKKLLNYSNDSFCYWQLIKIIVNNDNIVDVIVEEGQLEGDQGVRLQKILDYVIIDYVQTSEHLLVRVIETKQTKILSNLLKDRRVVVTHRVLQAFQNSELRDDTQSWKLLTNHPSLISPNRQVTIGDIEFVIPITSPDAKIQRLELMRSLSTENRFVDAYILKIPFFTEYFKMNNDQLAQKLNEERVPRLPHVTGLTAVLILLYINTTISSRDERNILKTLRSLLPNAIARLLPRVFFPDDQDYVDLEKITDLSEYDGLTNPSWNYILILSSL
ncbi:Hypothetical protein POVR1_LOCUS351 [uncultured virus]|nr:Hypothetical protein POVR1_LOCUS351 [uncultured virus]